MYKKLTPLNAAILISKPFSKFQKVKKITQKDPFKIQKSEIILKSKKVRKLTPPNVVILIPVTGHIRQ